MIIRIYTGIPHFLRFALLPFPDMSFFTKWSFVAIVHWESLLAPFFQQCLLTSCLCVAFWSFSQYFRFFHYYYVCYGDLWSVIFDVTIVIVLGCHETHPYKMVNLIYKCVCSDCSNNQLLPHLSPFPLASLFPETWRYWN